MEAESLAGEGRGNTNSAGIGRKVHTNEAKFSQEQEILYTGEGSHPSKKHKSDDVEIL